MVSCIFKFLDRPGEGKVNLKHRNW